MKRCYAIIIAASTLFVSCQSQGQENERTDDTTIVQGTGGTGTVINNTTTLQDEAAEQANRDTSFPGFVATLKNEYDNVKSIVDDTTVLVFTRGQLFYYNINSKIAVLPDGRSGSLPDYNVRRVNKPVFRFNFSRWRYEKLRGDNLYKFVSEQNLDLNTLSRKIMAKDKTSFRQFLALQDKVMDGPWQSYYDHAWGLINTWTDEELLAMYKSLPASERKNFEGLLMAAAPLDNPEDYYSRYYPGTFKAMQ